MGISEKKPVPSELPARNFARRSIVTIKDIPVGGRLSQDNLSCKRPGTGISPKYWEAVIGRRTKIKISNDSVLQWNMLD